MTNNALALSARNRENASHSTGPKNTSRQAAFFLERHATRLHRPHDRPALGGPRSLSHIHESILRRPQTRRHSRRTTRAISRRHFGATEPHPRAREQSPRPRFLRAREQNHDRASRSPRGPGDRGIVSRNIRAFTALSMHGQRLSSQFERTLKQLRALQFERRNPPKIKDFAESGFVFSNPRVGQASLPVSDVPSALRQPIKTNGRLPT